MKEYLHKIGDNKYVCADWEAGGNECIKIPEGAEIFANSKNRKNKPYFAKWNGKTWDTFNTMNENEWHRESTMANIEACYDILWRRANTKEYLNPADWTLHTIDVDNDAAGEVWLLVPEGAEWAKLWDKGNRYECVEFYRGDNEFFSNTKQEWMRGSDQSTNKIGQPASIVWQRHTQPEELPFIDDDLVELASASLSPLSFSIIDDEPTTAWDKQEGGSHYKDLKIQPMQYALENKLDAAQATVVKYVTRHANKNGKQDLLKAIHTIELMIEHYYGGDK